MRFFHIKIIMCYNLEGGNMNKLKNFIKGIIIGASMLVPGVSGGTMALILGIYDDLIRSVSSFFENVRKNALFLGVVAIGGLIGLVMFVYVVKYGLDNFRMPTMFLFLGVVLGGLPILFKESKNGVKTKFDYGYLLIGFVIVLCMTYFKGTLVNLENVTGLGSVLVLFLIGIIVAVALILPGISTSFLLLVLGMYEVTINAVETRDLAFLVPIIIGTLFGIIATTKVLEYWLNNNPRQVYMLIIGFVIASVFSIFPGLPEGLDILYSIIMFVIGVVSIIYITKKN